MNRLCAYRSKVPKGISTDNPKEELLEDQPCFHFQDKVLVFVSSFAVRFIVGA